MNHFSSTNPLISENSNDNAEPRLARGLERMRNAVSDMAANLETQQEAVSTFQSTIKGLRHEVKLLRANMQTFDRNLRTIKVEPLGRKARRLAAMMAAIENTTFD